jgi:hypothetical protein
MTDHGGICDLDLTFTFSFTFTFTFALAFVFTFAFARRASQVSASVTLGVEGGIGDGKRGVLERARLKIEKRVVWA